MAFPIACPIEASSEVGQIANPSHGRVFSLERPRFEGECPYGSPRWLFQPAGGSDRGSPLMIFGNGAAWPVVASPLMIVGSISDAGDVIGAEAAGSALG